MSVVAVVVGAGRGERLGGAGPKAAVRVAGRTLLDWSTHALAAAPSVDAVLPVVPAGGGAWVDELRASWAGAARLLDPVVGGDLRQHSVANGLAAAAEGVPDLNWILVHDAARCAVTPEDAESVLAAARETGAALPVVELGDTVKRVRSGQVLGTVDRAELAAAQTPQAFRAAVLREALEKAERDHFTGTDCASLVERLGIEVRATPGREENLKITRAADLARAEAILRAQGSAR